MAGIAFLIVVASGVNYSRLAASTYEAKNRVANLIAFNFVKPFLQLRGGKFLIGGLDNEEMVYTDHVSVPWYRLFDDVYLKYPIPGRGGDSHGQTPGRVCLTVRKGCMYLEGPAAYRAAIHAHWFAVVSMLGGHGTKLDKEIVADVTSTPGYVLMSRLGGAPTWVYAPDYRSTP